MGFGGSCAEQMRSWEEWQSAERDDAFACLEEPAEGGGVAGEARLRGWAGYLAPRQAQGERDEVAIQLQAVDSLGHRTLRTVTRDIPACQAGALDNPSTRAPSGWAAHDERCGYVLRDGFRLMQFDEVADVPADAMAGDALRINVIVADPRSGEGYAHASVSVRVE